MNDHIEIRPMRPGELASVHTMLNDAFPSTPRDFFDRQVRADPFLKSEDTLVLSENGIIRSCVRLYYRDIICCGEQFLMGGIGDVGTDPSRQGLGYASRLMETALEAMNARDAVFSILFTRIDAFYERFGYFTLPTMELSVSGPGPIESSPFREVDLSRDLPALLDIYDRTIQKRAGPVIRTKKYWEKQIDFPRLSDAMFWVAGKNPVVAYARGNVRDGALRLQDFGYLPGHEETVRNLILSMAGQKNRKEIRLLYVNQQEADLFKGCSVKTFQNTHIMIRLNRKDRIAAYRRLFQPRCFLYWEADRF